MEASRSMPNHTYREYGNVPVIFDLVTRRPLGRFLGPPAT
jgi:hypothetical protein